MIRLKDIIKVAVNERRFGSSIPKQKGETLIHYGFKEVDKGKWSNGKHTIEVGGAKPGFALYINGKKLVTDPSPFFRKHKRQDWNSLRGELKKLK
jgi:hypothetical protein